jgi:transcriptional regulator with XRE-family HTH domain
MTFGQKIKDRRKQLNMSQRDLASKMCVSPAMVAKWELMETAETMQISTLRKIATALEWDIQHLLFDPQLGYKTPPYVDMTVAEGEETLYLYNARNHSDQSDRILKYYNSLNKEGQEKTLDFMKILSTHPEYKTGENEDSK